MKKILIVIIVLLIAGAIYFLVLNNKTKIIPGSSDISGNNDLNNQPASNAPTVEIDPSLKTQNDLMIMSRAFIERYGTWSNQSNFENFEDLYPYMTERLKVETEAMVLQKKNELRQTTSYYGLTTKILSLGVVEINPEARAEFRAQVQQQETKDNATTTLLKNIQVVLIKDVVDWKIDQIIINP